MTDHHPQTSQAKRIEPGDVFLCYLTGRSRFVGALRATSELYLDHENRIWKSQVFPTRFRCQLIVEVPPDQGIHLREVQARSRQPDTYNWIFRASPQEMPADDSAWILERLHEIATTAPAVEHEVEIAIGEPGDELPPQQQEDLQPEAKPERAHVRIQWKLATLGHQMNLGVWIARNDKSAVYNDERLGYLSVEELPFSYDSTTQGTIETNRHALGETESD